MTTSASIVPVSVVVPCYRCADTIERAVRSVAQQTQRPAELILIDDASPDGTVAVLEALRAKYGVDWIRVLRLPQNAGPATARNAGWDAAREKYIAFLDSDDAWHPRKIEIQFGWMEAHPEVQVTGHGASQLVDQDAIPANPGEGEAKLVTKAALYASNRFITPSVMVRRALPQRFEPGARYMEDYLLWLEMATSGVTIAKLPPVLAYTFKAPYGEAGLSARLWDMEKGELRVFSSLRRKGLLGGISWLALSGYSLVKFVRRMTMLAAGYSPGGDLPKPALLYSASYLFLTQAMTALLIFAGLFGRGELAADIGVVQAATLATFYSFSGNARNLILTLRTTVPREAILGARLVLLLPLGAAAALLCVAVARIDPTIVAILIARRALEWIGELHLSECELLGRRAPAARNLLLQGVLLAAAIVSVVFYPASLLWVLGAWAFLPAFPLRSFIVSGWSGFRALRRKGGLLLPHFGSTAIAGISLYAFRALLVLLVGKTVAGGLFAAFALGSFPGSMFGNVLGPSVALHEERVGRAYLPRPIWLVTIMYVVAGFLLLVSIWLFPGLTAAIGRTSLFWSAVGWSLLGGAAMLVAQRTRIRLIGLNRADALFGADVMMYVALIASVPVLYATGQLAAMSGLYALNAALALLFYSTAEQGLLAHSTSSIRNWTNAGLCFFIFLPFFFLPNGTIFNPTEPLFDSGGVLANLPLPISLLACGLGLLLLGGYGKAMGALWTVLGMLFLMLVSTEVSHGGSGPLEKAKMLLLLQVLLPMFGLVLGSLIGAAGRTRPLQYGILCAIGITVPGQIISTLANHTFSLSHSVWLFAVYQHLQFVPVILVTAFVLVLPSLWEVSRGWRVALSLLSAVVAAYALASASMLAIFVVAFGTSLYAVLNVYRRKDLAVVGMVILTLGTLVGYGYVARNTDIFHSKFSFLFPAPDPWVIVDRPGGVRRTFGGHWIVTAAQEGRLMRLYASPERHAIAVIGGILAKGSLSFTNESNPDHVLERVRRSGPFQVRIDVDKGRGDSHILIFVDEPTDGVINELRWEFPSGAPRTNVPSSPDLARAPSSNRSYVDRIRNLTERLSDWRLFGLGVFDSVQTMIFGHATPLARDQRTSAHNFYIDFVYNFGLLALLPLLALIAYSGRQAWRRRREIVKSVWLLPLVIVVAFLVLVDSNFKVTLRQPYPGIAVYFLWGLLLARFAAPSADSVKSVDKVLEKLSSSPAT